MFERVELGSELELGMVRVWVLAPGPVLVLELVPVQGQEQAPVPVLVLGLAQVQELALALHRLLPRRLK